MIELGDVVGALAAHGNQMLEAERSRCAGWPTSPFAPDGAIEPRDAREAEIELSARTHAKKARRSGDAALVRERQRDRERARYLALVRRIALLDLHAAHCMSPRRRASACRQPARHGSRDRFLIVCLGHGGSRRADEAQWVCRCPCRRPRRCGHHHAVSCWIQWLAREHLVEADGRLAFNRRRPASLPALDLRRERIDETRAGGFSRRQT